jgi:hypothetical protein
LFDITNDPGEQNDLAGDQPEIVEQMKAAYDRWFDDVSATRGYDPPRIHVGTPHENPLRLSRQDLREGVAGSAGHWRVRIEPGLYDARLYFGKTKQAAECVMVVGTARIQRTVPSETTELSVAALDLPELEGNLQAWIEEDDAIFDVHYVELARRGTK